AWLAYDERRKTVLIHVLDLIDEEQWIENIKHRYERLLLDVIKGRLTHFMRRDELEAAWTWVEPILDGWQQLNEKPKAYTAGTWGPAASSALMAREGSAWVEES
ncbi:MAG: Na+/H+ antiporter subunit E, partial [Hydrogenophaga sp.]